jgi:hypothetical protein
MGAIIGIWWPTHVFQAAENLNSGARSFDKWRGSVR